MMQPPLVFTAARIASVLGRDKRGVLRLLQRQPATARMRTPGGQLADAWSVEALPANYRADLERLSRLKGFRDVAHLLTAGMVRWTPAIPLSEMDPRHVTKAGRVKAALANALALYVRDEADYAAVLRMAWQNYQKEFGTVSERQVRRILDRVIERDAGEERFDDAALYLDDKISCAKSAEAIVPGLLDDHQLAVFRYLNAVQRPSEPTVEETDLIWFAACQVIREQIECGAPPKQCRRSMVAFLDNGPVSLSKNTAALKILLKRKLARYDECGGAFSRFVDQRPDKSGRFGAVKLDEETRQLVVAHAAQNCGSRVAQAFRELRANGDMPAEIEERHLSNPASKSYVPATLRRQVQPDVRRLKNIVHGPRTHRLNGPYIDRDYDSMAAADWYQADDATLPVYYWEEINGSVEIMRGQFIPMTCVRTDFILGFDLISSPTYNSLNIRSLITACAAKHGLPRHGFYFERGIWKKSKIISGSSGALPFEHADRGLRSLGMDLRHARLPRGKVIERTIGRYQDHMEGIPGYAGRDERHDIRERVQQHIRDVKAGRCPAEKHFLHKTQWVGELVKISERHNNEDQDGKRLQGMCPREAWEKLQGTIPRQGFSAEWRYVLARDVRKVRVGRNGITLQYGNKKFNYRNTETGKREGDEILAWFDSTAPEVLACTDLEHKNLFSVPRANSVPAMDASEELLHEEMQKIEEHLDYARNLFWTSRQVLKNHHYRLAVPDAGTLEIGAAIKAQQEEIAEETVTRRTRFQANKATIERGQLAPELLRSADKFSPDTLKDVADFIRDANTEKQP